MIKNWLRYPSTIIDNFECFVICFAGDFEYQLLAIRSGAAAAVAGSAPCFVAGWRHREGMRCNRPRRRRSGLGGGKPGSSGWNLCSRLISRALKGRSLHGRSGWFGLLGWTVVIGCCRRVWRRKAARRRLRRRSKCRPCVLCEGCLAGSTRVLDTSRFPLLAKSARSSHFLRLLSCKGRNLLSSPPHYGIWYFMAWGHNE